jgi:hypothetical protein
VLYRSWHPNAWVSSLTSPDVHDQISSLRVATISAETADIVSAVYAALPA